MGEIGKIHNSARYCACERVKRVRSQQKKLLVRMQTCGFKQVLIILQIQNSLILIAIKNSENMFVNMVFIVHECQNISMHFECDRRCCLTCGRAYSNIIQ